MSIDTFQEVIHPAAPANCRTCGAPFGLRPLVDTGLTGDFCNRPHWDPVTETVDNSIETNLAGAVYICESCVINMGMVVGMLPAHKAMELMHQVAEQENVLGDLNTRIDALEKVLDGFNTLSLLSRDIDNHSPADASDDQNANADAENFEIIPTVSNKPPTESREAISSSPVFGSSSGSSETDKSSDSKNSDGVPSDSSSKSGERRDESDNAENGGGVSPLKFGF
jgi:hypothetical protein